MGTGEMTKPITEVSPRPLRLWPGIIAIVLLLLSRFAVKAVVPGLQGFMWAIEGTFVCTGAIVLWWVFFSRARWLDRIGAIVLIAAGLGSAWSFKHDSMGPAWMFAYAVPFVLLAFVAAAFAGRNLPNSRRRLLMTAAILLSSLGWSLVRMEGIDGDHKATFAWRWSPTSEQLLLTTSSCGSPNQSPPPRRLLSNPPSPNPLLRPGNPSRLCPPR